MPEQVHECVESLLDQNPEIDEPSAWAICQAEFNHTDGEVTTIDDLGIDATALDELAENSDAWTVVTGGWLNTDEQLAVYGGLEQQAVGGDPWSAEMRVFRLVPSPDDETEYNDDILGVGVDFPEAGVYVDWHRAAFPDQLEEPHVSEYGSISDLEKATNNQIVDYMPPRASSE